MKYPKFEGMPIKTDWYVIKDDGTKEPMKVTGGIYVDFCQGGCPNGKWYIINWNTGGLGYIESTEVNRDTVKQIGFLEE
jgi:hypothetical protein